MTTWIKGRTTGRGLLMQLQKLSDEDLDKNIFIVEGRHLYQPYYVKTSEKWYPELENSLVLFLANVDAGKVGNTVWHNTPDPIIKEGKAICPCCGEEVVRSCEVTYTRIPYFYYFCTKCIYNKEIMQKEPIPEARVYYPIIPEEYLKQQERIIKRL